MATKNTKAKTRPVEQPYETYRAAGFEWRVLKHYASPEKEATDSYARVFCATKSPYTGGTWEYGDAYLRDVIEACQANGGSVTTEVD